MKTLLRIDSSSRVQGSHSRTLADYFEKKWVGANPNGKIIYRDLAKKQLPHIHNSTIEGFYTPPEHWSKTAEEATSLSDELIAELKTANEVLISSPLYNLNVPSNLKAYFDQVVRTGHTFGINAKGYYGLLENKTAYIITVKGGIYKGTFMEPYDFQEPYLKAILQHMGISIGQLFSLEGTSDKRVLESNKKKIQEQIDESLKIENNGIYNRKDFFNDVLEDNATIILPNEGEELALKDLSFTFKVTSEMSNDQLGVYTIRLGPMAIGAKPHYHRFMDETFIVNKGILTLLLGDKELNAGPGTIVYVPRFTAHGFRNDTQEQVELTLLFNPSQKREGFFRGLYETLNEDPIDSKKYLKLYNKYDSFPVDITNMIPKR